MVSDYTERCLLWARTTAKRGNASIRNGELMQLSAAAVAIGGANDRRPLLCEADTGVSITIIIFQLLFSNIGHVLRATTTGAWRRHPAAGRR